MGKMPSDKWTLTFICPVDKWIFEIFAKLGTMRHFWNAFGQVNLKMSCPTDKWVWKCLSHPGEGCALMHAGVWMQTCPCLVAASLICSDCIHVSWLSLFCFEGGNCCCTGNSWSHYALLRWLPVLLLTGELTFYISGVAFSVECKALDILYIPGRG